MFFCMTVLVFCFLWVGRKFFKFWAYRSLFGRSRVHRGECRFAVEGVETVVCRISHRGCWFAVVKIFEGLVSFCSCPAIFSRILRQVCGQDFWCTTDQGLETPSSSRQKAVRSRVCKTEAITCVEDLQRARNCRQVNRRARTRRNRRDTTNEAAGCQGHHIFVPASSEGWFRS